MATHQWWTRSLGPPPRERSAAAVLLLAVLHLMSLSALFLVLLAAVVGRRIVPFFYWIEDTPLERAGRHIIAAINRQNVTWRRRLASAPLLSDEAEARDYLVKDIERTRPTHVVVLEDGTCLFGRMQSAGQGKSLLEYETEEETETLALTDAGIRWQKAIIHPPVELLPEDVRFLLNYPSFRYHYLPPYLFATDVPYAYVDYAYRMLSDLAAEFSATFRTLIAEDESAKFLYVCLLSNEAAYLKHAIGKEDVDLECSVGFYSPKENCLFVYDRLRSFARSKADRHLAKLAAEVTRKHGAALSERVGRMVTAEKARARQMLQRQVLDTLRHEGAHQLAFALGVHSPEGHEPLWIHEGLAQYCETVPIGALQPEQMRLLRSAVVKHLLIPWQQFVDTPTPRGLGYYNQDIGVAYAQAWLLFYHLMQAPRQPRFLRYLEHVRRVEPAGLDRPHSEILANCLQTDFLALSMELNNCIRDTVPDCGDSATTSSVPARPGH